MLKMEISLRLGPRAREKPAPQNGIGPDGRTYEQYTGERQFLIGIHRSAGDSFDKVLLTLAAGAIAVSVTFAEKLGAAGLAKPLLYVAWAVLALSLTLNLRGFLLLISSLSRRINQNDELYTTGNCETDDPFASKITSLNNVSFWSFCAGVLMLLIFAGVNYQAGPSTNEPEKVIVIMASEDGKIRKILEGSLKKTSPAPPVVKVPNDRKPSGTVGATQGKKK